MKTPPISARPAASRRIERMTITFSKLPSISISPATGPQASSISIGKATARSNPSASMTTSSVSKPRLPTSLALTTLLTSALCLLLSASALLGQSNVFDAPRPPAVSVPSAAPIPAASPVQSNVPGSDSISAPSGYRLAPNDQVAVEVFGEDDLRTNGRLNSEGNLSVPLLGSVHLAGLTLTEAAARMTSLYGSDYLVNPRISVSLIGYAKRRFTVLGQVNRPGS